MNLFESDISKSMKDLKSWGLRIPDSAYGKVNSDADFLALDAGIMYGIECKMNTSGGKSFNFNCVSESQIEGLTEIVKQGGQGYIIFNFRWMGSGNTKGKVFAITILEYLYLRYAFPNVEKFIEKYPNNDKSIPLEYFQKETLEIPKLPLEQGGYGWDLRVLFERGRR